MSDELTDEEIKAANYNTGVSDPAIHLPVPPRRWWKAFQPMIATRLATARNDALEEAKQAVIAFGKHQNTIPGEISYERGVAAEDIADIIEALKSETKP